MVRDRLHDSDEGMRAVVQRVAEAAVSVDGREIGRIGRGFVLLLGIARDDTEQDASYLADRIIGTRIIADQQGKMNLALGAVGGELLVISQFTLYADVDSGRRPSFTAAAPGDQAQPLYEHFLSLCRKAGVRVASGEFGAMMTVSLVNDGPVTIILDSRNR
jgi:D-tyrosyl-tRNA(Tyr) deacylase